MRQFLVGVDEAGRGPLAGPVAVGIVVAPHDFDIRAVFPGVADSKMLTEKKRESIFEILRSLSQENHEYTARYTVVFSSSKEIDTLGITNAVRKAAWKGIHTLTPNASKTHILLDGLLHAPPEYQQNTIIRGDQTEPIISLASIAAKVERDHLMRRLAKEFPHYGFEKHKGYGTDAHYEAIWRHGLCDIHRRTFGLEQFSAIGKNHTA